MTTNNKEEVYEKLYTSDKKNIYASVLILITIIVLFFFTKNIYFSKIENQENLNNLTIKAENIKKELDLLNDIKNKLNSDYKTKKDIEKYAWDYREDIILNSIFWKINWILIKNISMNKWQKLSSWLSMADISINVDVANLQTLNNYLLHLTSENSDMRFVVKGVNFPFWADNTSFNVSINLWMYYL
jgi:hypothetical protein